jgi:hypothetical protein
LAIFDDFPPILNQFYAEWWANLKNTQKIQKNHKKDEKNDKKTSLFSYGAKRAKMHGVFLFFRYSIFNYFDKNGYFENNSIDDLSTFFQFLSKKRQKSQYFIDFYENLISEGFSTKIKEKSEKKALFSLKSVKNMNIFLYFY